MPGRTRAIRASGQSERSGNPDNLGNSGNASNPGNLGNGHPGMFVVAARHQNGRRISKFVIASSAPGQNGQHSEPVRASKHPKRSKFHQILWLVKQRAKKGKTSPLRARPEMSEHNCFWLPARPATTTRNSATKFRFVGDHQCARPNTQTVKI